jgi:hypothetical protein
VIDAGSNPVFRSTYTVLPAAPIAARLIEGLRPSATLGDEQEEVCMLDPFGEKLLRRLDAWGWGDG